MRKSKFIRMLQGKWTYFFISLTLVLITIFVFYNHIQSDISRLDNARKKLAITVAQLQLHNGKEQIKMLTNPTISEWQEDYSIADSMDNMVIIYNRVPKTGSTSFMGVAYDLCGHNKFHVLHINTTKNSHVLSLSDQARIVHNITSWRLKKPAIYHGHMAFLDFQKFGTNERPIYINLIRKPLDRFISYYYFLRYGDNFRPHVVRRRQGNKMTFDECVEKEEKECNPENLWLQIPFFCGHASECWIPGSKWALSQAKQNLIEHYLLVGVTEEIQDFISLLEVTLPRFFKGATIHYTEGKKSHLRKTFNKMDPLPETITKIQQTKIWQMENEFYDFVLQQFHFIRKRTLTVKNGVVSDKGQQFMYEKIRPR